MKIKSLEENRVVFADERIEKQKARQSKFATLIKQSQNLAEKRSKGRLTLEDLYEQQQMIIAMLEKMLE